jgi:hypothetical protein
MKYSHLNRPLNYYKISVRKEKEREREREREREKIVKEVSTVIISKLHYQKSRRTLKQNAIIIYNRI